MLSKAVFESRLSAMRGFMSEHDLEALAFLTPDWLFYATNYPEGYLEPWERPFAAVIPGDGEPFVLMNEISTGAIEESKDRASLWVTDVSFYAEHPRAVDRLPLLPQWADTLAALLSAHGLHAGRVGVDTSPGALGEVARRLPGLTFVDSEPDLRELRFVKHPEEQQLIREAAALSDWGQERYRDAFRIGRLTTELDHSMGAQMMEEAARRHPGEHVQLSLLTLAGAAAASPHGAGSPTDGRIGKDDVIVNIVCVRLNGLWVENERTWFSGRPDQQQQRAFAAAEQATIAAANACRVGAPVCGIDEASYDVFMRAGFAQYVRHRAGHGMGIANHEFPHDMAFNTRPLRAGEVYSAEPGIYMPGVGGFRHDDTVIVSDPPEIVTTTPKDLEYLTLNL